MALLYLTINSQTLLTSSPNTSNPAAADIQGQEIQRSIAKKDKIIQLNSIQDPILCVDRKNDRLDDRTEASQSQNQMLYKGIPTCNLKD